MTTMIEFKGVSKRYGEKTVIDQLNLMIHSGEIFVLVGPSGSGKTSTLKMINGLSTPTDGDVYFKEKRIKEYDIQKMRWQMGYVLQQIALFPTMTVAQNIEVIPEMLGWSKQKRKESVDRLLEQVGLDAEQYRNRLPRELSGGEQQRIGILRAIAAQPDVILMDEPFSALDPISRTALQELVLQIHKDLGTTIVFVTHNMKEAFKLGDRIAVMKDGKLIQCDTPERIQAHPADEFVQTFFEETGDTDPASIVTLSQLIADHFYDPTIGETELPHVSVKATMETIYPLLAVHEAVVVDNEQGQMVGQVTRQHVFAFFSKEK